ncbi:hypothetical protein B0H11DRAFT_1911708 [Mycena galericulata]|nr:hypothetical protein B0H11DRAFT_1911708 [Mycena galericulata]
MISLGTTRVPRNPFLATIVPPTNAHFAKIFQPDVRRATPPQNRFDSVFPSRRNLPFDSGSGLCPGSSILFMSPAPAKLPSSTRAWVTASGLSHSANRGEREEQDFNGWQSSRVRTVVPFRLFIKHSRTYDARENQSNMRLVTELVVPTIKLLRGGASKRACLTLADLGYQPTETSRNKEGLKG